MKILYLLKILVIGWICVEVQYVSASESLPENLKWLTNSEDPTWCFQNAPKGGTLKTYLRSFPKTIRTVGPDVDPRIKSYMNQNLMGLTSIHPNTGNIIPAIATHWAYLGDNKTVFYKLNPNASWSDGKPVTADDFIFALQVMRSDYIADPATSNYYAKHFDKVVKYDKHTIAVVASSPKVNKDLHYYNNLFPIPAHFTLLDENFISNYNWKVLPNVGPYQIEQIKQGEFIIWGRKQNWWAKDLQYNKGCFNVNQVQLKVVKPDEIFESFASGDLDFFNMTFPSTWKQKSKAKTFKNGYAVLGRFYNDLPRPKLGMWLNTENSIFKDKNLRIAFAHSMNIEGVIKEVLNGGYQRLQRAVTGYGEYSNKQIFAREYNPKLVRKHLYKAGLSKENRNVSVKLLYSSSLHTKRLEVLKRYAAIVGIDLRLVQLTGAQMSKALADKDYDVVWMGEGANYRPRFPAVGVDEIDNLISKYDSSLVESERIALSKEIQQKMFEQADFIPTFLVSYFREGYWRYWKFPKVPATKSSSSLFEPFKIGGGMFWLDKKKRRETRRSIAKKRKLSPRAWTDKTYFL